MFQVIMHDKKHGGFSTRYSFEMTREDVLRTIHHESTRTVTLSTPGAAGSGDETLYRHYKRPEYAARALESAGDGAYIIRVAVDLALLIRRNEQITARSRKRDHAKRVTVKTTYERGLYRTQVTIGTGAGAYDEYIESARLKAWNEPGR